MNKAIQFANSQTRENLMRSFAGECQARARYTMAGAQAKQAKLQSIARIFDFTAQQEYVHATLFYRALGELQGQTVSVDGTYPVDSYSDTLSQLKAATHNEYQEWEHDYKAFGKIADEEDFPLLAKLFFTVADVERIHGDRFKLYAQRMEDSSLYADTRPQEWQCLHCGLVVNSTVAPAHCPLCSHPQGHFIRREENPYH